MFFISGDIRAGKCSTTIKNKQHLKVFLLIQFRWTKDNILLKTCHLDTSVKKKRECPFVSKISFVLLIGTENDGYQDMGVGDWEYAG